MEQQWIDGIETREVSFIQGQLDAIERLQQDSYPRALENLKLAAERYPEAETAIQGLIDNPDLAHKMFDDCRNYWRDFELPTDTSLTEQNRRLIVSTLEFERMPAYTSVHNISSGKYLVIMPCWFGPYWEATAIYIYDETQIHPQIKSLILPTYDRETGQIIPSPSNINYGFQRYYESTQVLTSSRRYSSTGDCGFKATYLLADDELRLTEFREQQDCNGNRLPSDFSDFPQIYP